ncbi:MAG: DUF1045 domain-containing protein [Acetobacteraceae bacterium]
MAHRHAVYRFAVYWAPPRGHALWSAGCAWLGRDPETGEALTPPLPPGLSADRHGAITRDPRRYGWHATLKAPFRLVDGEDEASLDAAIAAFAARRRPFRGPRLRLAPLSGFLAVTAAEACAELDALAADAVAALDRFRAPPEAEELDRRRRAGLTERQERLLARWGYPYVMEEWRFHMTLTGRLGEPELADLRTALEPRFAAALAEPPPFDSVALYAEPQPGAAFVLLRRYAFG